MESCESDEVEMRHALNPNRRPIVSPSGIVPTEDGVSCSLLKGKRGRCTEALANPLVTVGVGRRKVSVRAEPEAQPQVIRAVSAGYRKKYAERWPDDTEPNAQALG